jgi:hypothetical protein
MDPAEIEVPNPAVPNAVDADLAGMRQGLATVIERVSKLEAISHAPVPTISPVAFDQLSERVAAIERQPAPAATGQADLAARVDRIVRLLHRQFPQESLT